MSRGSPASNSKLHPRRNNNTVTILRLDTSEMSDNPAPNTPTLKLVGLTTYLGAVGYCYQSGYWGSFGINVAEYAKLGDLVSLTIYPFIEQSRGILAVGVLVCGAYFALMLSVLTFNFVRHVLKRHHLPIWFRDKWASLLGALLGMALFLTTNSWGASLFANPLIDSSKDSAYRMDWDPGILVASILLAMLFTIFLGFFTQHTRTSSLAVQLMPLALTSAAIALPVSALELGRANGLATRDGGIEGGSVAQYSFLPPIGTFSRKVCIANESLDPNMPLDAKGAFLLPILLGRIGSHTFFYVADTKLVRVQSDEQLKGFSLRNCYDELEFRARETRRLSTPPSGIKK